MTHMEDIRICRPDDVRVTLCGVEIDMGYLLHAIAWDLPKPEHDCTDQIDEVDCEDCMKHEGCL